MRGGCKQRAGRLGYAELEALVVGQAVLIGAAPDSPTAACRRPKRAKAQNLLLRLDEREGDVLRFARGLRSAV